MLPSLHAIAPGPVSELSYEENTDTSVTITWKPPKEPSGDLVAYFVEHGVYQNESTISVAIDARRRMSAVIQALGKLLPLLCSNHLCQQLSVRMCASPYLTNMPPLDRLHLIAKCSHETPNNMTYEVKYKVGLLLSSHTAKRTISETF